MTPTLGQPVTFTHHLERRTREHPGTYSRVTRAWEPVDAYPVTGQRGPVPGVIVGVRTLANGTVHYLVEDPTVFIPQEYVTAYLVAYHLRRAPLYVLPEHTTLEDQ